MISSYITSVKGVDFNSLVGFAIFFSISIKLNVFTWFWVFSRFAQKGYLKEIRNENF